jgi:predicted dehydrogenase
MNKFINVGLVGCGYWGPNLVRNMKSLPDCRVQVMCDLNEKRLTHMKSLYPDVRGEMDFSKLTGDPDLDAIVIATPVRYHFEMAKKSLQAGKHTFIEKPMAASSEQCEELIDIAEKNGLILMIGHTFLYSTPVRRIKEIVKSGDIGEIQYISARRLNLGLFQHDINVTWDLAPHDISIILYILDELPVSVNCRGNAHVRHGIEDVTSTSLTFKSDRFATIQNSWLDPRKVREMTIVGRRRMIVYDDMEPLEKIKIYDARVETPPHYDTFAEFQYSYHYGDRYIPHIKQEEPLKTECQHFLDCIRQGTTPLSDGKQGLDLVRILEASSISLKRNGAAVDLNNLRKERLNDPQKFALDVAPAIRRAPVAVGI